MLRHGSCLQRRGSPKEPIGHLSRLFVAILQAAMNEPLVLLDETKLEDTPAYQAALKEPLADVLDHKRKPAETQAHRPAPQTHVPRELFSDEEEPDHRPALRKDGGSFEDLMLSSTEMSPGAQRLHPPGARKPQPPSDQPNPARQAPRQVGTSFGASSIFLSLHHPVCIGYEEVVDALQFGHGFWCHASRGFRQEGAPKRSPQSRCMGSVLSRSLRQ